MRSAIRRKTAIVIGFVAGALALTFHEAQARFSMKVAYPSATGTVEAPLWVAKDLKLFDKYDVQADLIYIEGGTTSMQALIAEEIHVMVGDSTSTFNANLSGFDVVVLASHMNRLTYSMIVAKDLDLQLRGKTVGVSRLRGRSHYLTQVLLQKAGLPLNEVKFIAVGGGAARLASLHANRIQGAIISSTDVIRARRLGVRVFDLPEPPFLNANVSVLRPKMKRDREAYVAFLKGYVAGIHAFLTRDESVIIPVLSKYMRETDREILKSAYDYLKSRTEWPPYVSKESVQGVVDIMAYDRPEIKKYNLMDHIDASLLKELDSSGFLRSLGPVKK